MKKKMNERWSKPMLMLWLFTTALSLNAQGTSRPRSTQAEGAREPAKGGRIEQLLRTVPDITPEQEASIRQLHLDLTRQLTPLHARTRELQVSLESLCIAQVPDMKAIETRIDEIHASRAAMAKLRMKFRMDVRALLTPEQRVIFDSRAISRNERTHRRQHGPQGPGGLAP